ncbi:hypothetical protein ACU686_29525 [Yinghuangia aomiensis]
MLAGYTGDPDEVIGTSPPASAKRPRASSRSTPSWPAVPPTCCPSSSPRYAASSPPSSTCAASTPRPHPVSAMVSCTAKPWNARLQRRTGTLGPGNRANATLGRAVRFVMMHVAGGTAKGHDGGGLRREPRKASRPSTPSASPRTPPRARGLPTRAASASTHRARSPWPRMENPHNFHDMESRDPAGILDKAATVMATFGTNNAVVSDAEYFVVLGPEHAATIAGAGWARQDVQSYLFEKARRPAGDFRAHSGPTCGGRG